MLPVICSLFVATLYKPITVEKFAEHIAMLHSSMNKQFNTDYNSLVMENDFTFHTSKLEVNVKKNRYKNILPCKSLICNLVYQQQAYNPFTNTEIQWF